MKVGDLIRHATDRDSLGTVLDIDLLDIKVLWLDIDYPMIEHYPECELVIASSTDLD